MTRKKAPFAGLAAATVRSVAAIPGAAGGVYAGTVDECLWRKESAASDWVSLAANVECGTSVGQIVVDWFNPDHVLLTTGARLERSVDGGQTFETALAGLSPFRVKMSRLVPEAPVYAACGWNEIHRSDDGGATWSGPYGGGAFVYIQDMDACDAVPEVVYAAVNSAGKLYRSDNSGESWLTLGAAFTGIAVDVAVHPTDPLHVVAHYKDEGLFVSLDGGESWAPSIPGVISSAIREVRFLDWSGGRVGVASEMGFYVSEDGGLSFSLADEGMGPLFLHSVASDPDTERVLVGGLASGVHETNWED